MRCRSTIWRSCKGEVKALPSEVAIYIGDFERVAYLDVDVQRVVETFRRPVVIVGAGEHHRHLIVTICHVLAVAGLFGGFECLFV